MRALVAITALVAMPAVAQVPEPLTDADFLPVNEAEARLGQLLFYDPILSGNRNISCATCHHPRFATSDGVSLGMGEGGVGLGPDRKPDPANLPEQRIPRNAPALFNLGARDFRVLFHDGRVEVDPTRPSGLRTPLEDDMIMGFSGILSAQTMFPVLSSDEMAGHYQENDVAKAVRSGRITGPGGAWEIIAGRVEAIPAYRTMFEAVYPGIAGGKPVAFTDISNAIAAFMAFEWRADQSAFDLALRGEIALPPEAAAGMDLFLWQGRLRHLPFREVPDGSGVSRDGPAATWPRQGRTVRKPQPRYRAAARDEPGGGCLCLPHPRPAQRHRDRPLGPCGRVFRSGRVPAPSFGPDCRHDGLCGSDDPARVRARQKRLGADGSARGSGCHRTAPPCRCHI